MRWCRTLPLLWSRWPEQIRDQIRIVQLLVSIAPTQCQRCGGNIHGSPGPGRRHRLGAIPNDSGRAPIGIEVTGTIVSPLIVNPSIGNQAASRAGPNREAVNGGHAETIAGTTGGGTTHDTTGATVAGMSAQRPTTGASAEQ